MIETKNFRTKSEYHARENVMVDNTWGMALDIGYSSVKGFSPNSAFCFPSYAKIMDKQQLNLGFKKENEIIFENHKNGEKWLVGASAQDMLSTHDTTESEEAIYGRHRYSSPMFKVVAATGLGLGMLTNQYGSSDGKTLLLQTGLPPKYLKADKKSLKKALAGDHDFSITIGNVTQRMTFTLPEENISVMAQPLGTLLSISTDNKGRLIKDAIKYTTSNVLIFDAGFGTLDTFDLRNRFVENQETSDEVGMKAVLEETKTQIFNKYGEDISVVAMQKILEDGFIVMFDEENMISEKIEIADILEEANEKICDKAIAKVKEYTSSLRDHQYLVVTGGTGDAWFEQIKRHFSGMATLNVVSGNQNDTLPIVYSNVRGYYMYQYNKIKADVSKDI